MTHTRKGIRLTERQKLSWLQLIRSENVGPQTFRTLIEHFGSAENALEALPTLAQKGGKRAIRLARRQDAEREMEIATERGIQFIGIGEPDYPALLRQIDAPPPLLAVKGNLDCLNTTSVGIVGSRNASAAGMRLAAMFAKELGDAGLVTISGFARGIDASAHKASLGNGTIAVMAGGIEHIYPPENGALYNDILKSNGTVISEMPIGWEPRAKDFPRRNRLIAGIALGLLVVEAAKRSGSLITARLAADSGRMVFAVPGSPLDPRACGTNALIKEGANLVDCANDIIETLTPLSPEMQAQSKFTFIDDEPTAHHASLSPLPVREMQVNAKNADEEELSDNERHRILSQLSMTPVDLETLSMTTNIEIPKLYLALLELDLAGRILRHSGGRISLSPS